MMKVRALPIRPSMLLVVGLFVLASVFFNVHPVLAQCPLPDGATPPPDPPVTAQQVEDGSGSLMNFTLAARGLLSLHAIELTSIEQFAYTTCEIRREGSPYRSGSTYLIELSLDGRILTHAEDMSLSGRLLNPVIYGAILQASGINPADLMADHATSEAAFHAAEAGNGGAFNIPDIPGASGYATVYTSGSLGSGLVLLAGFDLNETHLAEEQIDYGNPATTAKDVVDRETLKAYVKEAEEFFLENFTLSLGAISKARIALRDPNGPWIHGAVYLYIVNLTSDIILFHGAFPDRFEFRPPGFFRDAFTGELVYDQMVAAATSSPEGGFWTYGFDDPTDDSDREDIPKVGYARLIGGGEREILRIAIGSGFYPSHFASMTGTHTKVEATVLGDAVEGLTVAFSRSIAGHQPDYAYNAVTDANGYCFLTISDVSGVSGYYQARARNADGETVGQWHSIPLNGNQRQVLELTLGGGMKVVRVEPLAAAKPVVAAESVLSAETVPEVSGLAPNFPNPFNSATLMTYHLSSPGPVQLVIYNVLGQPVRTLVDASQAAGSYQIRWDARDQRGVLLSTGTYIARLSYPGGVQTQRLLYLK